MVWCGAVRCGAFGLLPGKLLFLTGSVEGEPKSRVGLARGLLYGRTASGSRCGEFRIRDGELAADRLLFEPLNLTHRMNATHACQESPGSSELGQAGGWELWCVKSFRGGAGRHHNFPRLHLTSQTSPTLQQQYLLHLLSPLTLRRAPRRPDPSRQSLAAAPGPTSPLVAIIAANKSPSVSATSSPACIPKILARMDYPMPSMTTCTFTYPSSVLQMPYDHTFHPQCSGTDRHPSHAH